MDTPDQKGSFVTPPPLIAHVIYRLDVGGLENGLVNIINGLPEGKFRHAIICLTDYTDYYKKIRPNVQLFALHKKSGHDIALYWRLYKIFRELRPDIIHTRNLATLEAQVPAWLARVRRRVHGLHGWDISDLQGNNPRYIKLYRLIKPLINRFIPLSQDLERYLLDKIQVPNSDITRICNGVDTGRFFPADTGSKQILPPAFSDPGHRIIGTVGRLEAVKDQQLLLEAFIELLNRVPEYKHDVRLVVVGDGSMRKQIEARVGEADMASLVWLSGSRNDVPELFRAMDVFVLPSKAEGISNTLLEAMASALPVVATDVGGNSQLVVDGETGYITPKEDVQQLANKLQAYLDDPALLKRHARAARDRAQKHFSLEHMIKQYEQVYDELMTQ